MTTRQVNTVIQNVSVCGVGIDVSKCTLDVCLNYGSGTLEYVKVANTLIGWKEITAWLASRSVSAHTPILCEATGCYHLGVAHHLQSAGYLMRVTNPFVLASFAKLDMRKTKTDKVDSAKLSELALMRTDIPEFRVTSGDLSLKKLVALKASYAGIVQQLKNTLSSLNDTQSQGIVDLSDHIGMVKATLAHHRHCLKTINQKLTTAPSIKQATDRVGEIRGVSPESLATLIAELGDLTRFADKSALTAFTGLDPSLKTSGTSVHGRAHLSKRGSRLARRTLGQIAWGLMMHDPAEHAYYLKKKAEGKHYFTCLVAIARRFLIHLWTAIRKGEKFMSQSMIQSSPHQAVTAT